VWTEGVPPEEACASSSRRDERRRGKQCQYLWICHRSSSDSRAGIYNTKCMCSCLTTYEEASSETERSKRCKGTSGGREEMSSRSSYEIVPSLRVILSLSTHCLAIDAKKHK
jgi:hypothetical protein